MDLRNQNDWQAQWLSAQKPRKSRAIYQELNAAFDLSVAENVLMGHLGTSAAPQRFYND